jgi:hypothetical protein
MNVARAMHAATLLADGRVLVGGGTSVFTDPVAALANAQSSCEIWSPSTGQWTAAADLGTRRLAPALDALPNGKVLMSGGFEIVVVLGLPLPIGAVSGCRLYTVATNTWAGGPSMGSARALHSLNNLLLKDGRLLVTGGVSSGPDLTAATPITQCELYDAAANAWVPLPSMAQARCGHSVTQLADGRVFACGGMQGTLNAPASIALVQVLDPVAKAWAPPLPPLTTKRAGHGAAVTPDGLLVLFGGQRWCLERVAEHDGDDPSVTARAPRGARLSR